MCCDIPTLKCKLRLFFWLSAASFEHKYSCKEKLFSFNFISEDCGDEWPLDDDQRLLIQTNYDYLVDKMDTVELVNKMFAKECFNRRHRMSILAKQELEKTEHFLNVLSLRSIADFKYFLECLKETGQEHILTVLQQGRGIVSADVCFIMIQIAMK